MLCYVKLRSLGDVFGGKGLLVLNTTTKNRACWRMCYTSWLACCTEKFLANIVEYMCRDTCINVGVFTCVDVFRHVLSNACWHVHHHVPLHHTHVWHVHNTCCMCLDMRSLTWLFWELHGS